MTSIGEAVRVHSRCDDALVYYRLYRNFYLSMSPLQRRLSPTFSLVISWRSRWSALAEIIEAEERRVAA